MSTNRDVLSSRAAKELMVAIRDFLRGDVDEIRIRRATNNDAVIVRLNTESVQRTSTD